MAELLLGSRVWLRIGSEILSSRLNVYGATNREKLSEAVLASEAISFGYRPSPLAIGSSWSRRGNRWYRTVYPSRQAWWPKAQLSQVFPLPVGPVMSTWCRSWIH